MVNFLPKFEVLSTDPCLTEEKVTHAYKNLLRESGVFMILMQALEQAGVKVTIRITDDATDPVPRTNRVLGDPNAYIINIPKEAFDGEVYQTASGTAKSKLEGALVHELAHVYIDQHNFPLRPPGWTQGQPEDWAHHPGDTALGTGGYNAHQWEQMVMADISQPKPTVMMEPGDYNQSGDSPCDNILYPGLPYGPVAPPAQKVKDASDKTTETAPTYASPLVLDLDGSGTIDLISLTNSQVRWDVDEDDFAEHIGWVQPEDGFLVYDLNLDGIVNGQHELFGTAEADGFSQLALLDSNSDGSITAEDQAWQKLYVWRDLNGDGFSQDEELSALADLYITSIDLAAVEVSLMNEGNKVTHISSFTVDDGSGPESYEIHDIWFEYDNVNTTYVGEWSQDDLYMDLPFLRGYGTIPDLYMSLSVDDDGGDPSSLISLLQGFAELSISEVYTETSSAMDAVQDIMFRWASVDAIDPNSRGDEIDARRLAFLESMTGEPFLQHGYRPDPMYQAARELNEAFDIVQTHLYTMLAAQTDAGQIFTGDLHYNLYSDSLTGITGLDTAIVDDLEDLATALANTSEREVFWQNVVRLVETGYGVDNLDSTSLSALENAVSGSDITLDLVDILESLGGVSYVNEIDGTSSAETLTGTSGHDYIRGYADDDVLEGGGSNDELIGDGGNDVLIGGLHDDYLNGDDGNDTYVYNLGDGVDIVDDVSNTSSSPADKILFGAGIDSGDLTFVRAGQYDLEIHIDTGTETGQIIISDQFNIYGIIETIEFNDTTTIDLLSLSWTQTGTSAKDILYGVQQGGVGNDTLYGLAGDDTLYGYNGTNTLDGGDGNDRIYGGSGADTIYGGSGNDYIDGDDGNNVFYAGSGNDIVESEGGNDTYHYTSGNDVYTEGWGGTDAIYLASGYTSGSTIYYKINNDLKIVFDENNSITVSKFFQTSSYEIETLNFDGGPSVDLTTVSYTVQGGSGNDTLSGTSGADVFYGEAGDDTLTGNSGDDTLYGGTGNDSLSGKNNNDTLVGGAGDDYLDGGSGNDLYIYHSGHDTIYDYYNGTDTLRLAEGWAAEDVVLRRYTDDLRHLTIELNGGTANSIVIERQFNSSYYHIETLDFDGDDAITLGALQIETHGSEAADEIDGITSGASLNDIIYGFGGNDTIDGGSGNNYIDGGDGNDTLEAGNGADTLIGGAGNDYMDGGSGNDTYIYTSGLDTIYDYYNGTDKLIMSGGITINDLTTSQSGNDAIIVVDTGVDELVLEGHHYSIGYYVIESIQFDDGFVTTLNDHLSWDWGTSGADTLTGTSSHDTIIGMDGNDDIDGAGGADNIHGGSGDDIIRGGDSSDLLHGGLGDDILFGDAGADTIFGGDGADAFTFEAATAYSGIDIIKDFSAGEGDTIDLLDVLDGIYDPMTDDLLDFVQLSESAGDTLLSIDRDGTGMTYGWTQIASIQGVTGLGDADAMVTAGQLLAA